MTERPPALGSPRIHLATVDSTNLWARRLAERGAPHGTLVTAAAQSAGRGRQGRQWSAPPGTSLLMSLVLRDPPALLSLRAGVAVAETVVATSAEPSRPGSIAVKWPNDVLIGGRKVAGILVEGRPQDHWAVLGIGLNVAVELTQLPVELRDRAATLGRARSEVEPVLETLLTVIARWWEADDGEVLAAVRSRDALRGAPVHWAGGEGIGAGIDPQGRLLVQRGGDLLALDAGEVHLGAA